MSEAQPDRDVKLKRITIKTEAGTRWFATVEDFVGWVQQQTSVYSFLQNNLQNQHNERSLYQKLQQSWVQLQQFAQQHVKPAEQEPERYAKQIDELVNQFQQSLKSKQIFTTEAPFAEFLQKRVEARDYICAAVAIAYFLNENLNNFDLSLATALQKTLDWERGAFGQAEAESSSNKKLRESWDEEFSRQAEQAQQSQSRLDTLTERAGKLLLGQKNRFEGDVQGYEEQLEAELEKARQELNAITQTYEENLALHAPVRYWALQEKLHRRKMHLFAKITVGTAAAALIVLLVFAGYVLNQNISELIVGRLVTMAVLTTFAIWAVRLSANLFMAHTHLLTDAQERRTMIHTYLALLRKRDALQDDERQLILQTLFRPSTTGMIKDDAGPAHLVDLINRMAPKGQ